MNAVLVDTDVVSYLFKRDTRGALYEPHLKGRSQFISFMTLAELEWWAQVRHWGQRRRTDLENYLHRYTVIDSDRSLCQHWATVRHQAQQAGREIAPADAWIAATAILYQIPLITHNRSDFDWINDLTMISEAPQDRY
jgi:predicted nucleic acid-binding protein